ncbi:hypothetical protein [Nocardioides mangrovicus]|nr:hypothetical protein [Nocardioides mangrovicus]
MSQDYTSPEITLVASVHELTLDVDKSYHPKSDGYTFGGKPINVS